MFGLFMFGWKRLSKLQHLTVTFLLALGTNLSAVLILIANAWMQNPVGATFNPVTVRMELTSFTDIVFNIIAQEKFVHTISAGYVTGSLFVLGISSWYLLKNKHVEFAKRSFRIAAAFGLASSLSVVVLGDASGYSTGEAQQTKLAAMEAMWETEPAPASFNVIAWPNEAEQKNDFAIEIPYVMGIIGTHSLDKQIPGIKEIRAKNRVRIENGVKAVIAVEALRKNPNDASAKAIFNEYQADMGYGLLVKKYSDDLTQATAEDMDKAAMDTVPKVAPLFWTFRIMVFLGFSFIVLFAVAFWVSAKNRIQQSRRLLTFCLYWLPMPWVAIMCGWFVAEYGRQPWTVYGVIRTA